MGAIYAALATELGWTPAQVDEVTPAEWNRLAVHWRESPPVPTLVRAYLLGGSAKRQKASKQGLKELAAKFGGGR